MAVGLVEGEHLSVDGSFHGEREPSQSYPPRTVHRGSASELRGAQYLEELEQENAMAEPIHQQDKVSTTDPDSTYLTKGNRAAELGYFDNYLIDKESCVIVGVQATAARLSQETVAAQDMLTRFTAWQGGAGIAGGRHHLRQRGVLAMAGGPEHHPLREARDSIHRKRSPF